MPDFIIIIGYKSKQIWLLVEIEENILVHKMSQENQKSTIFLPKFCKYKVYIIS